MRQCRRALVCRVPGMVAVSAARFANTAQTSAQTRHDGSRATAHRAGQDEEVAMPSGRSSAAREENMSDDVPRHTPYAASDYDFMEKLQAVGADKAFRATHNRLVVYGIIGGACALYLFYFLTTRTYVLTTDKSPVKNTMFQRFPSDYAIVENRWTGKRTVECVESVSDAAVPHAADEHIITRTLHTNILLHRVYLYLQPTNVVVLINADRELQPFRFVHGSIDVARQSTAGWQRDDQQLPDANRVPTNTPGQQGWHVFSRHSTPGSDASAASPQDATEASRLYVESRVRLLDDYNGYQRGSKPTYEHTLRTVITDRLAAHYRECIIGRGAPTVRPAYADAMLKNGSLNGKGLALKDVVPDLEAFCEEVFDEVQKRMGTRIILYEHSVRRF